MLFQDTVVSRNLMGISSVWGNSHVVNATNNLHRISQFLARNFTIVSGSAAPISSGHGFPPGWISMSDNLTGFDLPTLLPYDFQADAAPQALVDAARASKAYSREFKIICIGPLTNIARAVHLAADFVSLVDSIVIMGGALNVPGNVGPLNVSEWNVYGDPVAADIVLRSFGARATLVPLDVVYPVSCALLADTVCVPPLPPAPPVALLCQAFAEMCSWDVIDAFAGAPRFNPIRTPNPNAAPDPVAGAYVLAPRAFNVVPTPVRVVLDGPEVGRTVVDAQGGVIVNVALGVQTDGVRQLLTLLSGG
jgi:inosine-uridine nucleoside N-ribohydrolase